MKSLLRRYRYSFSFLYKSLPIALICGIIFYFTFLYNHDYREGPVYFFIYVIILCTGVLVAFFFAASALSATTALHYSLNRKTSAEMWDQYIRRLRNDEKYALILRPFGNDGTIFVPRQSSFKVVLTKSIESVLMDVAKEYTMSVIAARYQGQILNLSGVHYVMAGHDWKFGVTTLIKRAFIVVFVLPDDKRITTSLAWEIDQCLKWGLVGRMMFILPPASARTTGMIESVMAELNKRFGNILTQEDAQKLIVFCPERPRLKTVAIRSPCAWMDGSEGKKRMLDTSYQQIFATFFERVARETNAMSVATLYPYFINKSVKSAPSEVLKRPGDVRQ